jgi:hypothetical protein
MSGVALNRPHNYITADVRWRVGMSYDSYQSFSHLTSDGWAASEVAPADRIETWRLDSEQQSPWSKQYDQWRCIWASPAVSRAERDELRSKYGLPGGKTHYFGRAKIIVTHGAPL